MGEDGPPGDEGHLAGRVVAGSQLAFAPERLPATLPFQQLPGLRLVGFRQRLEVGAQPLETPHAVLRGRQLPVRDPLDLHIEAPAPLPPGTRIGVEVLEVRTMRMPRKSRRVGRFLGRKPEWKKAIVRLAEGQTIEFFEGV